MNAKENVGSKIPHVNSLPGDYSNSGPAICFLYVNQTPSGVLGFGYSRSFGWEFGRGSERIQTAPRLRPV